MKTSGFTIAGGLDEGQIALILDDIHRLLGDVGLEIEHPDIVKELSDHDGVTVKNGRVCYSAELVEKARAQVATEDTNYIMQKPGHEGFELQTPFSPFAVIDAETGESRPAEDRDVIDGARLFDSFGTRGPVHVHIAEMDQRIAQIHIARLCCENSRAVGNWAPAYSYDQAMCVRDMYQAAGRPEPWVCLQMTHSPMRLDAYYLDILRTARDSEGGTRGFTGGGGAMPQAGVSAPVYWRAAAAQGLAEALGAWVTIKLIDPTVRPYASFTTSVTDMTTCAGWSQAPESVPTALLNRQLMKALLGTVEGEYIRDLPTMCTFAMQGARIFGGGGMSGFHEAWSAPQVIIDKEKLSYVEAAVGGLDFPDEEGVAVRIASETFPETSFLMHDATLEFRSMHWEPSVFRDVSTPKLADMLRTGTAELLPAAREIARETIAANDFALDDAAASEVQAIYDRGAQALTK